MNNHLKYLFFILNYFVDFSDYNEMLQIFSRFSNYCFRKNIQDKETVSSIIWKVLHYDGNLITKHIESS